MIRITAARVGAVLIFTAMFAASTAVSADQPPSLAPYDVPARPGVVLLDEGDFLRAPAAGLPIEQQELLEEERPLLVPPSQIGEAGKDSTDEGLAGPRGFGGMGGGSRRPGYKSLWIPNEPVRGQQTNLGMIEQDLSLMVPLWKNGPDGIFFSTGARCEIFHTDAVLPDSRQPFPDELWNIRFGTVYSHRFDNGWMGGANVNLGSASDQPFRSIHEATAMLSGFLRVPQGEHNAWLFSLNYSTNSQVLYGIPIPGVAYFYAPSEAFQATIGFPFASVNLRPWERWRFELMYALLTTIHTRAVYQPWERVECYAGFDWSNESYLLADRPEDRDRFYYYEKRLSGGIQVPVFKHVSADLSAGYVFDRYYFQGSGFRVSGLDRIDVGSGPFLALQIIARM